MWITRANLVLLIDCVDETTARSRSLRLDRAALRFPSSRKDRRADTKQSADRVRSVKRRPPFLPFAPRPPQWRKWVRVLVTGHRGYLGSVLGNVLLRGGFDVIGADAGWFSGCDFGGPDALVANAAEDFRDLSPADLASFDAVVHLAGLCDSASADQGDCLAEAINHRAALWLAECCRVAGVGRFLLASTCEVYGRTLRPASETDPVSPQNAYAGSNAECERDTLRLASFRYCPVVLRIASAYGVSPRLRLDQVVNDHAAAAWLHRRIRLRGSGTARRPLLHVEDIARTIAAMLLAPAGTIRGQVFNVVDEQACVTELEIAAAVAEVSPEISWSCGFDEYDPPNLVASSEKLRRTFRRLSFSWTLTRGVRQLHAAMDRYGLTPGDWRSDRYRRALRLRTLCERGGLNDQLHRPSAAVA